MTLQRTNAAATYGRARCRHCDGPIHDGAPVLIDPQTPWLMVHDECMRRLFPPRTAAIYHELHGPTAPGPGRSAELRRQLDQLEREITLLRDVLEGRRRYIPDPFVPDAWRDRL
jgi:hypothetical protein